MQRLIDANNLMDYCLNQKDRTVDCNDIARFPTILTIPDNPTNGNMIEVLFPNCVLDSNFGGAVITNIDGETQYWRMKWWNSPYKRGTDESIS